MGNTASRCEEAVAPDPRSKVPSSEVAVDEAAQEATVDTISGDGGCSAFGFAAQGHICEALSPEAPGPPLSHPIDIHTPQRSPFYPHLGLWATNRPL